jgi:predicted Kef-type K+ transport protein
MTVRAKFALMNAAIMGMLVKLALVDHTPAKTLVISAVVSFILLNGVMFYGIRLAEKRKNSK